MLPIAGQTAWPIGLTFFVDTHGWPGGVKGKIFKKKIFFYGQPAALQLFLIKKKCTNAIGKIFWNKNIEDYYYYGERKQMIFYIDRK